MKNTYTFTRRGDTVELRYEYKKEVINRTGYADGYEIDLGKEIKETDKAVVYVNGRKFTDGQPILVSEDIAGIKAGTLIIGNLRIVDPQLRDEIMAVIEETKVTGTTPEAAEMETEQIAMAKDVAKAKAQSIIEKAKTTRRNSDGSLMNQEQALEWRRRYNDVVNEGGDGYVPSVITQEEYDWAMDQLNDEPADKLAERGNNMTAREFLNEIGLELSEVNFALLGEYFDRGFDYVSFSDAEVPAFDLETMADFFERFAYLSEEE